MATFVQLGTDRCLERRFAAALLDDEFELEIEPETAERFPSFSAIDGWIASLS